MSEASEAPKITLVKKEKNPNRVANAKKLAGIRAEKKRLQDLKMNALKNRVEEYEHVEDREDREGGLTINYVIAAVGFVASAIAIYQFMKSPNDQPTGTTKIIKVPAHPEPSDPPNVHVTNPPGDIITFD